jgi:hypothetical protein
MNKKTVISLFLYWILITLCKEEEVYAFFSKRAARTKSKERSLCASEPSRSPRINPSINKENMNIDMIIGKEYIEMEIKNA